MRTLARALTAVAMLAETCATNAAAPDQPPPTASPIVQIADGPRGRAIVGCGVRFGSGTVTVELVLSDGATSRAFTLTARSAAGPLTGVTLVTGDTDTATTFGAPQAQPDGSVVTRGALPGLTGSELMRSVMVSGANLTLAAASGPPSVVIIPGPLDQQVRATYLNCAGDMRK